MIQLWCLHHPYIVAWLIQLCCHQLWFAALDRSSYFSIKATPPKKRAKRAQNDPWAASPGPWDEPGQDPWRFVCCGGAGVAGVSVVSGAPDDGVGQDPWHTEKQDKRDRTINLEAAMQMTISMSCGRARTSEYDANAANPSRIRTVVGTPCKRKSRKKPGCQEGGLNYTATNSWMPGPV